MGKRAQVTIFIIIGIIILIAVGIALLARKDIVSQRTAAGAGAAATAPAEFQPAAAFAQRCLQKTLEEGIDAVARRGGYLDLPERATAGASMDTAYYFYLTEDASPDEETLVAELGKYVDAQLPFCLRNFADFPGLSVVYDPADAVVAIEGATVTASIRGEMRMRAGDASFTLAELRADVPARLSTLFRVAKELSATQAESPGQICLSCIADKADENAINITVAEHGNDTLLVILKDEQVPIAGQPLRFRYANKYAPPQEEEKEAVPAEGTAIPDQRAVVGRQFLLAIPGAGEGKVFSDSTERFDINPATGGIDFIPAPEDVGEEFVWITLDHPDGSFDVMGFRLIVEEAP